MSNYDTQLPLLTARTLTAAQVMADTSLTVEERNALLIQLGMRENRARPRVRTRVEEVISLIGSSLNWESGTFLDEGEALQSIKIEILENSEGLSISSGGSLGGATKTDTGVAIDVRCNQGEELFDNFLVNFPAHVATPSKVRITFTYIA